MGKPTGAKKTTIGSAPGPTSAGKLKRTKRARVPRYEVTSSTERQAMENLWKWEADAIEETAERFCDEDDYAPKPMPFEDNDFSFEQCWQYVAESFDIELKEHEVSRLGNITDILVDPDKSPDTKARHIRSFYFNPDKTGILPGDIEGQDGPANMHNLMQACDDFENWDNMSEVERKVLQKILFSNVVRM